MKEVEFYPEGEKIDLVINQVIRLIEKKKLKPDWRGAWFSNKSLDSVRKILEKRGLRSAQIFLEGRLDARGNRFERIKNQILLEAIKKVETLKLDIKMASYVIGKLNSIIDEKRKELTNEND